MPGAEIHLGTIKDVPFEDAAFDAIAAVNILEHLTDPLPFMRAANRLLKPDGILMFKTVSIDSILARKKGGDWDHLKWPGHLIWYSEYALTTLLDKNGFTPVQRYVTGIPYIPGIKRYMEHKPATTDTCSGSRLENVRRPSLLKQSIKIVFKSRLLRNAVSRLINWLKLGDTVMYVGKKK